MLTTKEDTLCLKEDILMLREDISKLHLNVNKRFDITILWTVGTAIGMVAVTVTMIKFLITK